MSLTEKKHNVLVQRTVHNDLRLLAIDWTRVTLRVSSEAASGKSIDVMARFH